MEYHEGGRHEVQVARGNLPDGITEDALSTLFADVGTVSALELPTGETSGAFAATALLQLETEPTLK